MLATKSSTGFYFLHNSLEMTLCVMFLFEGKWRYLIQREIPGSKKND